MSRDAVGRPMEILKSENLGVDSYLTKPVDWGQFLAVIKSLRRFLLSDVVLPR